MCLHIRQKQNHSIYGLLCLLASFTSHYVFKVIVSFIVHCVCVRVGGWVGVHIFSTQLLESFFLLSD